MKRFALTALAFAVTLIVAASAGAHCQIPCGIYDDELRVQLIEEHITTVEKSMHQIISLSAAEKVNYNQLVRWIDNKEKHAQEIQDIVTAYFMAQRIKSPISHDNETEVNEYLHKLALLHAIQVHAMKAKQSTDLEEVATLRDLVAKFRTAYFGEEGEHAH
ncbi:MAG: superoxide dismutase, Ni [Thermoanaerobaculales bacterium]|jgi:nickel superoxide dismutase|nr:superoxide dismutase, Ni [Thermoanaerobaculales bacterium]